MEILNLLIAIATVVVIIIALPYVIAFISIVWEWSKPVLAAAFVGGLIGGISLWLVSRCILDIDSYFGKGPFIVGLIIGAVGAAVLVVYSALKRN